MELKSALAALVLLGTLAAPAFAQNSQAEPPVIAAPPPPKAETPPPTTAPPPATAPAETAPAETTVAPPPETVVVVPQPQPAPAEPVTIDPDAAYPNGFADPADPFANDMSLAYGEERGGFDWGLLGLLGLLGLIPLLRDRGGRRVVYVEREDDARRAVRRERIDE
jgi:outer membrane biosynthesis protein TonB